MQSRKLGVTDRQDVIRPTQFYVVVKLDPAEAMTNGGLIVPDTVQGKEQVAREKGVIMSVGPTAFPKETWGDDPPKVGDRVMFARYAGTLFRDREKREDYRIFEDSQICAVCEEA